MDRIGLAETMEALRAELETAAEAGQKSEFRFPVQGVELEFHVGVTRSAEGNAGVKLWVVELGTAGAYAREDMQTVRVSLGAPVDRHGQSWKISKEDSEEP